jgi:20S proteasome alpha/beta subunit
MTLTICIIAKDGIILTSDSRATSLLTANDTVKKIFKLQEHFAVGIAGDGSLAMHLFNLIQPKLKFNNGINILAEQFRDLLKEKYDNYFPNIDLDKRPNLSILLGGYTVDNKPKIILLNSEDNFVPRESTTGFECIGIPIIATYLLNRYYEHEITSNGAILLSTYCIKETSSQDYHVGGSIQVSKFSNIEDYKELTKEEISTFEKTCEEFKPILKGKFYPEE